MQTCGAAGHPAIAIRAAGPAELGAAAPNSTIGVRSLGRNAREHGLHEILSWGYEGGGWCLGLHEFMPRRGETR